MRLKLYSVSTYYKKVNNNKTEIMNGEFTRSNFFGRFKKAQPKPPLSPVNKFGPE